MSLFAVVELLTVASLFAALTFFAPIHRLVEAMGDWLASGRQAPRVAPTNTRGSAVCRVQFVDAVALGWCE